jgi:tetratricopeptide (TPR) repeat protein
MVKGDTERAIADYGEVIRINPTDAMAYFYRAMAWNRRGVAARALADYEAAIGINPDDAAAFNNIAWMLAVSRDDAARDGRRAIELARRACDLTSWENAGYLDTLAAAYAEAGDFREAVRWQEAALGLPDLKQNKQAQARLELYRSGKPYREQADAP